MHQVMYFLTSNQGRSHWRHLPPRYFARTNNCEHLINWAIADKKESAQIDDIKVGITLGTVLAGVAVLGLAAGAALLYNAFDEMTHTDDVARE